MMPDWEPVRRGRKRGASDCGGGALTHCCQAQTLHRIWVCTATVPAVIAVVKLVNPPALYQLGARKRGKRRGVRGLRDED